MFTTNICKTFKSFVLGLVEDIYSRDLVHYSYFRTMHNIIVEKNTIILICSKGGFKVPWGLF